jgi:hypothetical protein
MEEENPPKEEPQKETVIRYKWKPIYGWVLLANLAYVLLFYLIMISNS